MDGHDLWSDNDDRSQARDWTCRGHGSHSEGNIIDWIVTLKSSPLVATIVYQIHMANASTEISLKPVKSMI